MVEKLKSEPIGKSDIADYISSYSDFAFELKVLSDIQKLGFSCVHDDVCEGPDTKKGGEFNIRALQTLEYEKTILNVHFSIKCKNIKKNFPLVIHCMPRVQSESYCDLIWMIEKPQGEVDYRFPDTAFCIRVNSEDQLYTTGSPVGKSCDQVGRAESGGEIFKSDTDIFEKISQSINGSFNLVKSHFYDKVKEKDVISLIIPILIVADDSLWSIKYDSNGNVNPDPHKMSYISYFINKNWLLKGNRGALERYGLSHLEIIERGYFSTFWESLLNNSMLSDKKMQELIGQKLDSINDG